MRNPLSQQDKYVVQGMVSDGYDIKDIASSIGRKTKTVENYVNNELDKIHDTIAKVQTEKVLDQPDNIQPDKVQPENTQQAKTQKPKKSNPKKRNPKNKGFINKTSGGSEGIAISTNAASAQSDELRQLYPKKLSRSARGNLFNINEETVIEE